MCSHKCTSASEYIKQSLQYWTKNCLNTKYAVFRSWIILEREKRVLIVLHRVFPTCYVCFNFSDLDYSEISMFVANPTNIAYQIIHRLCSLTRNSSTKKS